MPYHPYDISSLKYDGYGFLFDDKYREPLYWRHIKKLEKRYGKINV